MPRNARIGNPWSTAFDDDRVAATHATCVNFDTHLSRAWGGNLELNDSQPGSSRSYLGRFHGGHCDACRCHKSLSAFHSSFKSLATMTKRLTWHALALFACPQNDNTRKRGEESIRRWCRPYLGIGARGERASEPRRFLCFNLSAGISGYSRHINPRTGSVRVAEFCRVST